MTRVLLAAPATAEAPFDAERHLARLARALRDAGHEVVHAGAVRAGQGRSAAALAAAAVQEDVEVVVLVVPDADGPGRAPLVAETVADLVGVGADEDPVAVLVASTGEEGASVVGCVVDATRSAATDQG